MSVRFDDSSRCNGHRSGITGRDVPLCITCARYTLRPDAEIEGRVFWLRGVADCEHWKPNEVKQ